MQIRVVLATDHNYIMPLAVAVCSAAVNCAPRRDIVFSVIQSGVDTASRTRVERSLAHVSSERGRIEWIDAPSPSRWMMGQPLQGVGPATGA